MAAIAGMVGGPNFVGSVAAKSPANGSDTVGNSENNSHRREYPRVSKEAIPDESISEYATEIAVHPNQRRAAITTGKFGNGFQLYVVQRVEDEDSIAEKAWRITDSDGFVAALEWDVNNRLRVDESFTRYELKLPPSHKIFDRKTIEELSFQGVNSI